MIPTLLSAHFTLEELCAIQQRGMDNTPPPAAVENLRLLAAETLEVVRSLLGPLHINSGYRSPEVNTAVGGQLSSQHCLGLAADFVPVRFSLAESARRIIAQRVTFDQLLFEFGSWLHISHTPVGRLARGQALMVGKWTGGKYVSLDLAKVPA